MRGMRNAYKILVGNFARKDLLRAGAGVYCDGTRRKLSFSLGQYTTVFQAEVYALKVCAVENLDRNYKNSKHLYSIR
jgi:hypothetical protein